MNAKSVAVWCTPPFLHPPPTPRAHSSPPLTICSVSLKVHLYPRWVWRSTSCLAQDHNKDSARGWTQVVLSRVHRRRRKPIASVTHCIRFLISKFAWSFPGQPLDFTSNNAAEPQPPVYLLTSGTVLASVSWGVGSDGKAMAPPLLTTKPSSNLRYCRSDLVPAQSNPAFNSVRWIRYPIL